MKTWVEDFPKAFFFLNGVHCILSVRKAWSCMENENTKTEKHLAKPIKITWQWKVSINSRIKVL